MLITSRSFNYPNLQIMWTTYRTACFYATSFPFVRIFAAMCCNGSSTWSSIPILHRSQTYI
ncbi:hypothetical protein P692DRAFT_20379569 [Suillus brevipes Sb2]|nr:hypothetical protein P692DRAFT_20379569 [Suillus brevipes Sb2]